MSYEKFIYEGNIYEISNNPLTDRYRLFPENHVFEGWMPFPSPEEIKREKKKYKQEYLDERDRYRALKYRRPTRSLESRKLHYGTWEVKDKKLYLVDFFGYVAKEGDEKKEENESEIVGLSYLFPNQKEVFAEWFTGEIAAGKGKNYKLGARNGSSLSSNIGNIEEGIHLKFEEGVVTSSRIIDNKKSSTEEYRDEIDGMKPRDLDYEDDSFSDEDQKLHKEASAHYNKLLKTNPKYAEIHLYIGELYHALRKFDKAINSFNKALKLNPMLADAYSNLAYIYSQKENSAYYDIDRAINLYQKSIDIDPVLHSSYYQLGLLFAVKKETDEAISNFQNAINHGPKLDKSFKNWSSQLDKALNLELYYYTNDLMKAYKVKANALLDKMLDESTDGLNNRVVLSYIVLADFYAKKDKMEDAIKQYQKSIDFERTPDMSDNDLKKNSLRYSRHYHPLIMTRP